MIPHKLRTSFSQVRLVAGVLRVHRTMFPYCTFACCSTIPYTRCMYRNHIAHVMIARLIRVLKSFLWLSCVILLYKYITNHTVIQHRTHQAGTSSFLTRCIVAYTSNKKLRRITFNPCIRGGTLPLCSTYHKIRLRCNAVRKYSMLC